MYLTDLQEQTILALREHGETELAPLALILNHAPGPLLTELKGLQRQRLVELRSAGARGSYWKLTAHGGQVAGEVDNERQAPGSGYPGAIPVELTEKEIVEIAGYFELRNVELVKKLRAARLEAMAKAAA